MSAYVKSGLIEVGKNLESGLREIAEAIKVAAALQQPTYNIIINAEGLSQDEVSETVAKILGKRTS